jgi:adenylate kinase
MSNIILFGPPGSGKGTQTEQLIQKYNFVSIALGELLRKQIIENSVYKVLIEAYINNGQLIPDSFSFKLVAELVQEQPRGQSFLFDGFPRTIQQATFLDNLLTQHGTQIDAVIFLDVPEEHLFKRLQDRAIIEGRLDDQDEYKIKTRMYIYEQETLPIVTHYKSQNKLYRIDGIENTDQVTQAIETIINGLNL